MKSAINHSAGAHRLKNLRAVSAGVGRTYQGAAWSKDATLAWWTIRCPRTLTKLECVKMAHEPTEAQVFEMLVDIERIGKRDGATFTVDNVRGKIAVHDPRFDDVLVLTRNATWKMTADERAHAELMKVVEEVQS